MIVWIVIFSIVIVMMIIRIVIGRIVKVEDGDSKFVDSGGF